MNTEICTDCGNEMEVGDWPYCPHERYARHHFVPVEVDLGKLGKHTAGSFADFARLEKMHKRETGQEIAFRALNNNQSNQDSNSMGNGPSNVRPQTRSRRGVPYITQRGGKYEGE